MKLTLITKADRMYLFKLVWNLLIYSYGQRNGQGV